MNIDIQFNNCFNLLLFIFLGMSFSYLNAKNIFCEKEFFQLWNIILFIGGWTMTLLFWGLTVEILYFWEDLNNYRYSFRDRGLLYELSNPKLVFFPNLGFRTNSQTRLISTTRRIVLSRNMNQFQLKCQYYYYWILALLIIFIIIELLISYLS